MPTSIVEAGHDPDALRALRRLIAELANRCAIDLNDSDGIRKLLHHPVESERIDPQAVIELRNMLILLFRLEASSSEDIGIDGLRKLWHQYSETLARHGRECEPQAYL